MEALVAERLANGPFASLDDFAERIDPRLLNRRQLESLAAAGAFDSLNPDRAAVYAAAETILAHAASASHARTSGQGGLFGGPSDSGVAPIRLPRDASWTLAERMTAERDAFGFYFSAHPVDAQRHLLAAHKVRRFADLAALPAPADGGRSQSMMAGLVEAAKWATSAKGRRYMRVTLSDPSGQFDATAFDDEPCAALEAAAKSGACGLMTVELDRRPGDDLPRVAIKRFQPLEEMARRTRLQMTISVSDVGQVASLSRLLSTARGGNGAIRFIIDLPGNREAQLLAGRDFALDADLAAQIERLLGPGTVDLSTQSPPQLAIVA